MSRQYFADMPYADPALASQTAITATSETALFPVAQYLPIPASDARVGKTYWGRMGGIYSTASTGTLTITPRYGTTTSGVALGASVAQTVPASVSNVPWRLEFELVIRTANNGTATSSTAYLTGNFFGSGLTTVSSSIVLPFGGTQATIDTTTAQGIWIGWTLSVAGSCTPGLCLFGSFN